MPNKITGDLRAMIIGAMNAHGGQAYLEKAAIEAMPAFLGLVGKILPTQVTGSDGGPIQVITGVARDGDG